MPGVWFLYILHHFQQKLTYVLFVLKVDALVMNISNSSAISSVLYFGLACNLTDLFALTPTIALQIAHESSYRFL
jgi:hypothetical protein